MANRIVIAKPGLDGHDRGAKIVARALRDAGYEVIYTGLHQTPEQIAETAIQEDADAVGLSCHSGAHMTLFPKVVRLLHEQGADDVLIFGGGIIPKDDIPKLQDGFNRKGLLSEDGKKKLAFTLFQKVYKERSVGKAE